MSFAKFLKYAGPWGLLINKEKFFMSWRLVREDWHRNYTLLRQQRENNNNC